MLYYWARHSLVICALYARRGGGMQVANTIILVALRYQGAACELLQSGSVWPEYIYNLETNITKQICSGIFTSPRSSM